MSSRSTTPPTFCRSCAPSPPVTCTTWSSRPTTGSSPPSRDHRQNRRGGSRHDLDKESAWPAGHDRLANITTNRHPEVASLGEAERETVMGDVTEHEEDQINRA